MLASVPLYEYRCRTCDSTFDLRRAMSEANDPADCPQGHPGAVRLLSVFASVGANGSTAASTPAPRAGGGCGASCGCAH